MDMKKILQALDGVGSKPVENINDMKRFLMAVSDKPTIVESTEPLLKKYVVEEEHKVTTQRELKQAAINKKAKRIAEAVYMNGHETEDKTDTVKMDIPLLIRLLEYAREEAESDIDIHNVAEQLIALSKSNPVLSMKQYETIIGDTKSDMMEDKKPLAVIVKGNPKYLNKHKKWSTDFYNSIKEILVDNGYRVKFDAGKEYTEPDKNADVWIGHSKGADRLRFAPKDIDTLEIKTKSNDGDDHDHYIASKRDITQLKKLISEGIAAMGLYEKS